MTGTQTACNDALLYYFDQVNESDLTDKSILVLQGQPGSYDCHLKSSNITALSYCARASNQWVNREIKCLKEIDQRFDLAIHFATKSEPETGQHLALALNSLKPDGFFIGVVHNRQGAAKYKRSLESIFSPIQSISKSKSRLFFAPKSNLKHSPTQPSSAKPSHVGASEYYSLPGVYGGKAIDKGSAALAALLRQEYWSGIGADIGCGFGYLTGEILKTRHRVKQVYLYDIDSRALEMSSLNLTGQTKLELHWVDIPKAIPAERPVHWAVMNPPFHSGSAQDFELGKSFITQAAKILRPGSPLFMVANVHLPYEETLHQSFRSLVKLSEQDGFKCFKAVK